MNPFPHPLPLRTDGGRLSLRRLVVPTSVGEIVVHAGREAGGPATVLLHGAAGSWTTWTPLITASDLSDAPLTDVVAIDLPGWGESGSSERVHSVEDMSDAIVEVARALGYDEWMLVGHSLGGFIALDVAARHPASTVSVTLVSASGAAVIDAIRHPVRGGRLLPGFAGMLLTMRALRGLGASGLALVRALARMGWMPALTAPLFAGRVHPSVIDAFACEVRPAAFAHAAHLASEYEERTWTGIACPVRAVRGARDVFAGESDAGAFVALIPDFREVRLQDVGHFAHVERPDAVLDVIYGCRDTVTTRTASASSSSARSAAPVPVGRSSSISHH